MVDQIRLLSCKSLRLGAWGAETVARRIMILTRWTVMRDFRARQGQHDSCWQEKAVWKTLRMVIQEGIGPGFENRHGANSTMQDACADAKLHSELL